MDKFIAALAHLITDAKMRPEIKLILGIPVLITAVVYGIVSRDWLGFGSLAGLSLFLFGLTAWGDAQIDKGA